MILVNQSKSKGVKSFPFLTNQKVLRLYFPHPPLSNKRYPPKIKDAFLSLFSPSNLFFSFPLTKTYRHFPILCKCFPQRILPNPLFFFPNNPFVLNNKKFFFWPIFCRLLRKTSHHSLFLRNIIGKKPFFVYNFLII